MLTKQIFLLATLIVTTTALPKLSPLSNATLDKLEGTWSCPGYGKLLTIKNRQVKEYHSSSLGCLILPDQSQATIKEQLAFIEILSDDSFIASLAPIGNRYYWERSSRSVSNCKLQTSATPLQTFDFFDAYMKEHYAFFEERGVNWDLESAKARAKLSAHSSDAKLFETLKQLIEKLEDPHTALYAGLNGQLVKTSDLKARTILPILKRKKPSWNGTEFELFIDWIIDQLSNLENAFLAESHGVIPTTPFYWRKFENIGYLHIGSMAGFKPGGNIYQELLAFESALDKAFTDLADSEALILDLSFNLGGYEWLSIALAQRLARSEVDVFKKKVHGDQGTQSSVYTLTPSLRPNFHGPVYLLTSDITISAGEACTDAIRALPQTRHYGMRTAGAMSNVLSKPLPNGWGLTLSNEIYTDLNDQTYEAVGFTPEVVFELWDPNDPYENHLNRINRLLTHIKAIDRSIELSWQRFPSENGLSLNRAETGSTLAVQKSTDLLHWDTIKELSFTEPVLIQVESAQPHSRIFYRAIQL